MAMKADAAPAPRRRGVPKGTPRSPNAGRKKGTLNKNTTLLKDAVLRAAEVRGQKISTNKKYTGLVSYLDWLSWEHPAVFGSLLSKVLPLQIAGSTDGDEGINIQINFTEPPKVIEHAPRFIDPEHSSIPRDGRRHPRSAGTAR